MLLPAAQVIFTFFLVRFHFPCLCDENETWRRKYAEGLGEPWPRSLQSLSYGHCCGWTGQHRVHLGWLVHLFKQQNFEQCDTAQRKELTAQRSVLCRFYLYWVTLSRNSTVSTGKVHWSQRTVLCTFKFFQYYWLELSTCMMLQIVSFYLCFNFKFPLLITAQSHGCMVFCSCL